MLHTRIKMPCSDIVAPVGSKGKVQAPSKTTSKHTVCNKLIVTLNFITLSQLVVRTICFAFRHFGDAQPTALVALQRSSSRAISSPTEAICTSNIPDCSMGSISAPISTVDEVSAA
jgi:hypothetical protein